MSLNDPALISTPPLDPYTQNLQISDYTSFPSLSGTGAAESLLPGSLSSRAGLAPEFVPSRPQSRPTSRHQSPARHSSRLSAEENETFPALGSAVFRGAKKHHGKRGGHGHGPKEPNSMADVVRMSPGPSPAMMRKGLVKTKSYLGSSENSAAEHESAQIRIFSVREPTSRGTSHLASILGGFDGRKKSSRDIPEGATFHDLDLHVFPNKDSKQ